MESFFATPSGISVQIVNTLMRHNRSLPRHQLAKLVGRPRAIVDKVVGDLVTEGIVLLVEGDVVKLQAIKEER